MRALRQRHSRIIAIATTALLVLAAVAYAATSGNYKGRTSQHQNITFQVSHSSVKNLAFKIVDKCPNGDQLNETVSGFPSISISHSKFGGTFDPNDPTQPTVVSGKFSSSTKASGSLKDTSRNSSTGQLCKGSATFKASYVKPHH